MPKVLYHFLGDDILNFLIKNQTTKQNKLYSFHLVRKNVKSVHSVNFWYFGKTGFFLDTVPSPRLPTTPPPSCLRYV